MYKNKIVIIFLAMCLMLGTVPFAMGSSSQSSNTVYISALDIGAPRENMNQEYVKITNSGKTSVNLKGWEIQDYGAKHTYIFSSRTLGAKSSLTLKSGYGKDSGSTLYWNKNLFIWNNDGDTAYLYNAQGKLVSSKSG